MCSYNAKPLSGRRLHHNPAFQAVHYSGSQRFQTCNLGGNIVSFNINVNSTRMFDALDLHDKFVWRCIKHAIVAPRTGVSEIYRTAKRISPELGGLINI